MMLHPEREELELYVVGAMGCAMRLTQKRAGTDV